MEGLKRVMRTEKIDNVVFHNFPILVHDNGEEVFEALTLIVAERIVNKIPKDLRDAVSIDFSKVNEDKLVQEVKNDLGIVRNFSDEELAKKEQELIRLLEENGMFN